MTVLKNLPEDTTFFTPTEGDYSVVIVPFSHQFNPQGSYFAEYRCHTFNTGNTWKRLICPNLYGGFCVVCAALSGMDEGDKLRFRPKRRVIYNVIDLSIPVWSPERKVQFWDVAWWFSQKEFENRLLNINVPHKIDFYIERKGGKYIQYFYENIEKGYYIPPHILNQAKDPNDFFHIPEYDEVEQAFNLCFNPQPQTTQEEVMKNILKFQMPKFHYPIDKPIKNHREYTRIVEED